MDGVGAAACRRLRGENDPGYSSGNLTQVAGNQVLSRISLDVVTAVAADEEVVAGAALDHVSACPAVDGVAIVAAIEPIDPASSRQAVPARFSVGSHECGRLVD